jgi:hypothetical protein
MITSYYIDKEENELYTFIGNYKHVVVSDIYTEDQADKLIRELNGGYNNVIHYVSTINKND